MTSRSRSMETGIDSSLGESLALEGSRVVKGSLVEFSWPPSLNGVFSQVMWYALIP